MQQLHERLSAWAEHFETTGPEDDNLQKGTDRAVFAGLLHRAAEVVKAHAPQPVGLNLAAPGKRDETVVAIYDGSGGRREQWREGDKCTVDGEGGQVFTVSDLAEHSAMMLDAEGFARGREGYQKMHKVPGARSGLVIDPADATDFVHVVESSPGLTREGEEHLADVLQDAADSIHELLQPGERGAVDDVVFEPEEARVHVGLLHRAAGALRARPAPVLPPNLVTQVAAAAHALEQYEAVVSRSPAELAAEAFTNETVVETAVKVLREIVDAVDKAPETIDVRFDEVHYATGSNNEALTVLRFTGIPDLVMPDADAHQLRDKLAAHAQPAGPFWTVTVGDDPENSEDMWEIAIPASPEVDAAMVKWAQSFDEICAVEEGRELHEQPVGPRLGAHDSLIFRQRIARADLDEDAQILNAEGVKMLLDAVATLQDGESLSLAGGHLATTLADLDDREPRYFGDLWSRSDAVDARGMRGDHHHPDDMAVGDEDPTPEDLADQAFARETDPPNLPQTLAANYVRQGWMLHQAIDRSVVHLIDAEIGTLACEPSATVSGMHIDPDGDLGALKLCGRCCAAANDRASQP